MKKKTARQTKKTGRLVDSGQLRKLSTVEREIRWLVKHRKDEVKEVLRNVRRLMRGRRHFSANVLMLVSLLEIELARQKKTPLVDAARGRR